MALILMLSIGAGIGIYTMLPLFLVHDIGFERGLANTILGLSRISGAGVVFFAGLIIDRIGHRRSMTLFLAIMGTQIFAALMCGFGWIVPPLPWELIGLVWLYNLAWMFVQDIAKLAVYYVLDNRSHRRGLFFRHLNRYVHPHGAIHG